MITYVILSADKSMVIRVEQANTLPQYSLEVMARIIDVSSLDPKPEVGWLHNAGVLTAPPTVKPTTSSLQDVMLRLIQRRLVYVELGETTAVAQVNSNIAAVKSAYTDLKNAT